jgi:hypothetical protein
MPEEERKPTLGELVWGPANAAFSMLIDAIIAQRALLALLAQKGQLQPGEFETFLESFSRQHREQIDADLQTQFRVILDERLHRR